MNAQKTSNDRDLFLASLNAVPVCKRRIADTDWFPAVDVSDIGSEYLFEFDMPGLTRQEMQISLDEGTLSIAGVRTTQQYGGKSLRAERAAGAFVRRLVLPPDGCADEIHANLNDGVLQVRIAKRATPNENGRSNIVPFQKGSL